MLDIISMTILIIFIILFGIIAIFIIIGGNMNKSEEERKLEDEEQIKYIKEYNERKQHKKRSK
jgi:Na+/H+ antiporter NhaC